MSSGLYVETELYFVESGNLRKGDCDLVLVRFYATYMSNQTSWDVVDHRDLFNPTMGIVSRTDDGLSVSPNSS
jgi:hypothetical protein